MPEKDTRNAQHLIPFVYKGHLRAELSIIEVKGKSMQSNTASVRVDKISVNGLRFLSELLFPVNPQFILNLQVFILNETIDLKGTINWSQRKEHFYLYEVVFNNNELTKAKLIVMLNDLARHDVPLHLRAEYGYNTFLERTHNIRKSRINFLI